MARDPRLLFHAKSLPIRAIHGNDARRHCGLCVASRPETMRVSRTRARRVLATSPSDAPQRPRPGVLGDDRPDCPILDDLAMDRGALS